MALTATRPRATCPGWPAPGGSPSSVPGHTAALRLSPWPAACCLLEQLTPAAAGCSCCEPPRGLPPLQPKCGSPPPTQGTCGSRLALEPPRGHTRPAHGGAPPARALVPSSRGHPEHVARNPRVPHRGRRPGRSSSSDHRTVTGEGVRPPDTLHVGAETLGASGHGRGGRAPLVSQGACRRLPVVTFLSNSAQKAPHPRPPASTDRWNRRRPTVAPSQGGCPGGHRGKGQTTEARTSLGTCVVRAPAGGGLLRMPGDVPGASHPHTGQGRAGGTGVRGPVALPPGGAALAGGLSPRRGAGGHVCRCSPDKAGEEF